MPATRDLGRPREVRRGAAPSTPLTAWGSVEAPQATVPGRTSGERFPELDGHRALAVLGVVVFHVYQFCNVGHYLYFGTPAYSVLDSLDAMVPWLFVLSGFLLFAPMARAMVDGGQPMSARTFLARRAIRILPVYYAAVAVVWFLRQGRLPGDWRDLVEHLTFTQVFDDKRIFYTIGPAWAVSVAVMFYLTLALLTVVLGRICRQLDSRASRIALLAAASGCLVLVTLVWDVWAFSIAHRSTLGSATTWFGPMANLGIFAVGMAVAVVAAALGDSRPLTPRARLGLRLAGLALLVLAFATRQPDAWSSVVFPAVCSVGFGCLVAAAVLGPVGDRWGRALSHSPLPWLGTIALSIYLWHEPIMLALRGMDGLVRQTPSDFVRDTFVVVIASIVIGCVSYLLIERPSSQLRAMYGRDGD